MNNDVILKYCLFRNCCAGTSSGGGGEITISSQNNQPLKMYHPVFDGNSINWKYIGTDGMDIYGEGEHGRGVVVG
jgi:hypothetical protein